MSSRLHPNLRDASDRPTVGIYGSGHHLDGVQTAVALGLHCGDDGRAAVIIISLGSSDNAPRCRDFPQGSFMRRADAAKDTETDLVFHGLVEGSNSRYRASRDGRTGMV